MVTQTLRGVGSYQIKYLASAEGYASQVQVTTLDGEVINIHIEESHYVASSESVRLPSSRSSLMHWLIGRA